MANYPKRTTLAIAIAAALYGCGGGGVDPIPVTTSLTGVVVDGYLSGSTVFWDVNNNGIQDSGEPSSQTDSSGHFSLALFGTANQVNGAHLRIMGGTDTSVNEPFTHSMSVIIEDAANKPFVPITPLSSLIDAMVSSGAAANITQARDSLARVMGLSSAAAFDQDPLTQVISEPTVLQKMVSIQKAMEVLASADRTSAEGNPESVI